MSADNFWLVRKKDDDFYVTMCFASDYEVDEDDNTNEEIHWPPIENNQKPFNTFEEVQKFLHDPNNWAEYPPVYDFPTKIVEVLVE